MIRVVTGELSWGQVHEVLKLYPFGVLSGLEGRVSLL